jgi:hypothetical protein
MPVSDRSRVREPRINRSVTWSGPARSCRVWLANITFRGAYQVGQGEDLPATLVPRSSSAGDGRPPTGNAGSRRHGGARHRRSLRDRAVVEAGRCATLECRVRLDLVELWFEDRCRAVLDRDRFRAWLDKHPEPYAVDDVIWTAGNGTPAVLLIRDCGAWEIGADLMAGLRAQVQ